MNFKKHTKFMIDFISDFVNGEIDRYFFNMDYSAYVIQHFPYMEKENARLAERFAYTVDQSYERCTDLRLSDERFRAEISEAFDEWLGKGKIDSI